VSTAGLERRYRLLLVAYPAAYRRRHGDELLDVLLASSRPGTRWPEPRQTLALVRGGLRARRGFTAVAQRWWRVADLTALALTAYALVIVAGQMRRSYRDFLHGAGLAPWFAQEVVTAGLLLLLLSAVVAGYRRTAAGLGVATGVVPALMSAHGLPDSVDDRDWWAPVIVAVLFGTLLLSIGRPHDGSAGRRLRLTLGLLVTATAAVWTMTEPVPVRPLYLVVGVLCLAYLGAVVDPAAVVAVASLLLPPVLAATSHALIHSVELERWATLTALRLLVVVTCVGFAATVVRAESRI